MLQVSLVLMLDYGGNGDGKSMQNTVVRQRVEVIVRPLSGD
jgi:hypothetical protein